MCAILDANCRDEVFGSGKRPEAAEKFLAWLEEHGNLVVGGKLRKELGQSNRFLQWSRQAIIKGLVTSIDDLVVDEGTENLNNSRSCQSNDAHIIALAQVSKARLLYSKDTDLHSDFQNSNLINNPRGKIYSTLRTDNFSASHRRLLSDRSLCRN